jgi:hypothetical protein
LRIVVLLVTEDKDVELAVFLTLLVFDLEVELLDEFLPVAVGKVASFHQIVSPFHVLVVVEFDYVGNALVHQYNLPPLLTHSELCQLYLRIY